MCHKRILSYLAGNPEKRELLPRSGASGQSRLKSCKRHPEISPPMPSMRRPPVRGRCWSMTAIAGSAATGRATGRSSPATASSTGPIRKWRRNIPRSRWPIFSAPCNTSRPTDTRASAAEASFLTLSHARGKGFWLALYRKLPGFAAVSELAYAFIAAHRPAFYRVSLLLWGRDYEPPRYDLVSFLFLRLFGLIYLSAFVSFGVQAQGLIGSHGILPLAELVDAVASRFGPERFFLMPMVFWWNASDFAIQAVCWAGAGLSLLLVFNLLPRLSLFLLYVLYLSLLYAGQAFMTFQWDTFLLEAGFLALLLSFATTPGIWLLRWLLFRFMFMSGVVKLLSGDPNWWNLSALSYHFLTQPLPTPLAWYAAQLPPRRAEIRHRRHVLRRADSAVPDLLPAPAAVLRRPSASCCCKAAFSSPATTTGSISRPCCCACCCSTTRRCRRYCRGAWSGWLLARAEDRRRDEAVTVVVGALALLIVFCSLVEMDERFGGSPPDRGAGRRPA